MCVYVSEGGWVLTGFHALDVDMASFGGVVDLDGRHAGGCLKMLSGFVVTLRAATYIARERHG